MMHQLGVGASFPIVYHLLMHQRLQSKRPNNSFQATPVNVAFFLLSPYDRPVATSRAGVVGRA